MSSSNAFAFRGSVPVEIVSEGGFAELSLVDAAYNVVGQGIGRLDLTLPPGQYQLRQCIGDAQTLEAIDIERTNVEANQAPKQYIVPAPKFTSAALVRDETAVLGMAPAPETPVRARHRDCLRLIISASIDEALESEDRELAISHFRNESARLRLESLKGELLLDIGKGSFFDKSSSATIHELQVEVDPGEYVLVQSGTGSQGPQASRQRCLPLIVTTGFSPRVYLRTLLAKKPLEPTAVPVPVDLDTAAVIYWPKDSQDSPGTFELGLIESARKALIRGHAIGGYWKAASRPEGSSTKSPLLALMDGYLLLSELSAHGAGLSQVGTAIKDAEALLGLSFTDVVALRLATKKVSHEDAEVLPGFQSDSPDFSLSGPPLLARSWHELLVNERANQELSRVMPFEYVPEATGTWFTWTEAVGARTQEKYPDKTIAPDVKEAPSTGLSGLFKRYYSRHNADVMVTAALDATDKGASHALDAAVKGLVALMQNDVIKDIVVRMSEVVANQEQLSPSERMDPLLVQAINGLATMQNKLLLAAFSQEELARAMLLGFHVPSEKLPKLLKSLKSAMKDHDLLKPVVLRLASTFGRSILGAISGYFKSDSEPAPKLPPHKPGGS